MIRTTDQVMTRDGRAARILSFTERHEEGPYNLPILAEVEHPSEVGVWLRWHYMADGRWKSNGDFNDPNDLIAVSGAALNKFLGQLTPPNPLPPSVPRPAGQNYEGGEG
jgi:hypothetical protein